MLQLFIWRRVYVLLSSKRYCSLVTKHNTSITYYSHKYFLIKWLLSYIDVSRTSVPIASGTRIGAEYQTHVMPWDTLASSLLLRIAVEGKASTIQTVSAVAGLAVSLHWGFRGRHLTRWEFCLRAAVFTCIMELHYCPLSAVSYYLIVRQLNKKQGTVRIRVLDLALLEKHDVFKFLNKKVYILLSLH